MKKILLCSFIVLLLGITVPAAQQDNEDIRETIKVVNTELLVRVYYKGKPVDNLTKSDFKLYENKKLKEINGFFLKRKKMKIHELELTVNQEKSWEPRYFILAFHITHYNDYIKKGLDYIFDNILMKSDKLLAFVNDRTTFFDTLEDKTAVKTKLDRFLADVSLESRNRLLLYLMQVENEVGKHKFQMSLRSSTGPATNIHILIYNYFNNFQRIWNDYKQRYLVPDIDKYYNFAHFLKDIRQEKWVIDFYQFELFPNIMVDSESMQQIKQYLGQWQASTFVPEHVNYARLISRQLIDIEKDLNLGKDFPAAEVARIFQNAGATFHSIFMRTSLSALQEDVEYKQISTELEHFLREITDKTGGKSMVSNKLDTTLDAIGEEEDIHYMLTFVPENPDKVGKIKIKTNNDKYKLIYNADPMGGIMGDYLAANNIKGKPVKIKEFKYENGKLLLVITDFYRREKEGGNLAIRIQVKNEQGAAIFDQKKTIAATQDEIRISLNIAGISKGKYDFVVDVEDLIAKHSAAEFFKSEITR